MNLRYLIALFFSGLIIGAFGRLALPGPDPMGLLMTSLIGIGGAFVGGIAGLYLLGRPGGFMLAVLAATGLVYLVRRSRRSRP